MQIKKQIEQNAKTKNQHRKRKRKEHERSHPKKLATNRRRNPKPLPTNRRHNPKPLPLNGNRNPKLHPMNKQKGKASESQEACGVRNSKCHKVADPRNETISDTEDEQISSKAGKKKEYNLKENPGSNDRSTNKLEDKPVTEKESTNNEGKKRDTAAKLNESGHEFNILLSGCCSVQYTHPVQIDGIEQLFPSSNQDLSKELACDAVVISKIESEKPNVHCITACTVTDSTIAIDKKRHLPESMYNPGFVEILQRKFPNKRFTSIMPNYLLENSDDMLPTASMSHFVDNVIGMAEKKLLMKEVKFFQNTKFNGVVFVPYTSLYISCIFGKKDQKKKYYDLTVLYKKD